MSSLRRALAVVQPIVIALAFVLLGLLLRSQWDHLRALDWRLRPLWLLASGVCMLAGWLTEIRLWQLLLRRFGGRLPYPSAVRVWFASAIVRYVPGNIWQPLSLATRSRERGVRPEVTLASLSLFQAILILGVGLLTAGYLAVWGRSGPLAHWLGGVSMWWSPLVAGPVIFFLFRPGTLITIANLVLKKMGREPLPLGLSSRDLMGMLGIALLAWMCFCAAFTLLAGAVLPLDRHSLWTAMPHLMAAYPIAFATGFLSLLTPGGLLVRDGMLFLMLTPVIGQEQAIVVALAMRAWEIVLDGLASAGAIGLPHLLKRRSEP